MKKPKLKSLSLVACYLVFSSTALAIAPPSPGGCYLDKACTPKRATWGHNETKWNRWPTDIAAPATRETPTKKPLRPFVAPKADAEDLIAPKPDNSDLSTRGKPVKLPIVVPPLKIATIEVLQDLKANHGEDQPPHLTFTTSAKTKGPVLQISQSENAFPGLQLNFQKPATKANHGSDAPPTLPVSLMHRLVKKEQQKFVPLTAQARTLIHPAHFMPTGVKKQLPAQNLAYPSTGIKNHVMPASWNNRQ